MFEHFDEFCELAKKYNIKFIVGLLTGFMSSRRFVPPALNERNIFADYFAQRWTLRFVKYFVNRYIDNDAIIAWDLGNEVRWLDKAEDIDNSYVWASMITDAIKSIDHKRPVVSGLDTTEFAGSSWNTMDMGEVLDVLTSHPYVCFSYASGQPINSIKAIRYVVGSTVAMADIGRKPCLLEEVGSIGYSTLNERSEQGFMRGILFDSWVNDCHGMMWWCAFDQGTLSHNPYRWNGRGSDYGLFTEDYRVKPIAEETKKFYKLLRDMPFKKLPERIKDAVCIVPRGAMSDRNYVSFIDTIAKQAGLDIEFSYADQKIKESALYIVPSVLSAEYFNKDTYLALFEKVKNGASVFISMDNCYLRWFDKVTGLNVYQRKSYSGNGMIDLNGEKIRSFAKYEYICDSIDGEVLAHNENGNPVFVRHKLGKGYVYSFLAPFETAAISVSDICDTNAYKIYEYLRDNVSSTKVAKCRHSQVGITEHILNENERILVLINYSPDKVKTDIEIDDAWEISDVIYGQYDGSAVFAENEALVIKITKK
jgi:endo-1,4-beta-mannosidase